MQIQQILRRTLHHSQHLVPAHIIKALSTAEMKERAAEADEDLGTRVRLLMAILEGLSIDPHGLELLQKRNETHTTFNVHFHTISNPLDQIITLRNENPLCGELADAIATNIASKKFKAAKMYRRLQPKVSVADSKIRREAQNAYDIAIGQKKGQEFAQDAFDKAFDESRIDQLDQRLRKIAHAACPSIADKGYSAWLAELLYNNL